MLGVYNEMALMSIEKKRAISAMTWNLCVPVLSEKNASYAKLGALGLFLPEYPRNVQSRVAPGIALLGCTAWLRPWDMNVIVVKSIIDNVFLVVVSI